MSTHASFDVVDDTSEAPAESAARADGPGWPAALAPYRDLTALRYDFPLVLGDDGVVRALSAVIDQCASQLPDDADRPRARRELRRIERRIRERVALGGSGTRLSTMWDAAVTDIGGVGNNPAQRHAAPDADGPVVDCDGALSGRLMQHAWRAVQDAKARAFEDEAGALSRRLADILRADAAVSASGRTAERLRQSLPDSHAAVFDVEVMSEMLRRVAPDTTMSEDRRRRIEWALSVLAEQRFFGRDGESWSFSFTSCAAALNAFWARRSLMQELITAMNVARLEVDGALHAMPDGHDWRALGPSDVDRDACALFPDYLVLLDADTLSPAEQLLAMDALAAGIPLKIVLQTDDVLEMVGVGPTRFGFAARNRQLTGAAIALTDVFVVQTPASHALKSLPAIEAGLRFRGPALFSWFSGAAGTSRLPAYLIAAAALDARVFPCVVHDPERSLEGAGRVSFDGNPQPLLEWPVHHVEYEDAEHQAHAVDVPFTLADFIACDERYAALFEVAPPAVAANDLLFVDEANHLRRVAAADFVWQEAARCQRIWQTARPRAISAIREAAAEPDVDPAMAAAAGPPPRAAESSPDTTPAPAAAPAAAPATGEPFIETPRCSTCNECISLNNRMFAYNENRQAYIADASAGTYRQLVEAAEGCQMAIIHPGRPRNPNEPGLEELIARAETFA